LLLLSVFVLTAIVGFTAPDWSIRMVQAIAWPVVVVTAIVVLARTRVGAQFLQALSARLTKVSVLGVVFELTPDGAKKVQYGVESALDDYRNRLQAEYDRQVQAKQVNDRLALVVEEAIKIARGGVPPTNYRCTIHVEDVLLVNALYQLVDYYPQARGSRGRRFGIRYGMIGKTWRLRVDQIAPNVFDGRGSIAAKVETLIKDWAMTHAEATAAAQDAITAFVVVVIKEGGSELPVALLYFDSKTAEAFGDATEADKFAAAVRAESDQRGLTKALIDIGVEMRQAAPKITVFK
jgi:hypothetical protein